MSGTAHGHQMGSEPDVDFRNPVESNRFDKRIDHICMGAAVDIRVINVIQRSNRKKRPGNFRIQFITHLLVGQRPFDRKMLLPVRHNASVGTPPVQRETAAGAVNPEIRGSEPGDFGHFASFHDPERRAVFQMKKG